MSISTLDGVIAGMQYPRDFTKAVTPTLVSGRPHSLFYLAGVPPTAVANSAGVGGVAVTLDGGQISFTNPVSGNTYLARFSGQATIAGRLLLCDRLWHNSGLNATLTSAQTVNSVAFPARDANGSINGENILIGLEVTGVLGAGTPNLSMSYTNQAGVSGRTGAGILTVVTTSAVGAFYQMGLQAGDTGVRSVQTFTLSASMVSGSYALVAYRILAGVDITNSNVSNSIDALTGGFPRMFDNSVPFLIFIPSITTASNISGQVIYSQG